MGVAKRNAIVFATDRALFPVAAYQATRLASLTLPPDTDVVIATEDADGVRLALENGAEFRPLLLDPESLAGLAIRDGAYLSPAAYYRYFLPRLLGGDYRRLLYLDLDIHIYSSRLAGLFDIGMRGHAVGGVCDPLPFRGDRHSERELRGTLSPTHRKYLNTGVLLIDPTRFAEQELEARLLATTRERKEQLLIHDQSAINIVLDGNWLELSPSFNMFAEHWNSFVSNVCEPIVVHFIGDKKPWHGPRFRLAHPAKAHMERYFPGSPWPDFLARFYSSKDAWQLIQDEQKQQRPRPQVALAPAFMNHLLSMRFADVDQGLTKLRLDAMPDALPVSASMWPTLTA